MGESDALVAGVLDRPNDDAPILVLCDWLDERDDRRGPLLRRYLKRSRADRDRRVETYKRLWENRKPRPGFEWASDRYFEILREGIEKVEGRLVGWFVRHFPDEFIRCQLAATDR